MATCGYICPVCEGRNYLDDGSPCNYCNSAEKTKSEKIDLEDEGDLNPSCKPKLKS